MTSFIVNQLVAFIFMHLLALGEGILVTKYSWKVNYTRKINHFFVFLFPYFLKLILPYESNLFTQIGVVVVGLSSLIIYLKPIRENVKIVGLMFAAFDRPEDRPHTLKWLFTQYLATYLVGLPLWYFFNHIGHPEAIPLIMLINCLGDGLAEPVGVTWGKHKYKVKALFTTEKFTRSLEGSACVLFFGIVVIIAYQAYFTKLQFIFAMILVPIGATLAEAKSPHTWDSPFIFGVCGLLLLLVYTI